MSRGSSEGMEINSSAPRDQFGLVVVGSWVLLVVFVLSQLHKADKHLLSYNDYNRKSNSLSTLP